LKQAAEQASSKFLTFTERPEAKPGADLGGRVQGVRTPIEMKPSSSYWLLKLVYLTGQ